MRIETFYKYKSAYAACMEFFDELTPESRVELDEELNEIFGEKRRC